MKIVIIGSGFAGAACAWWLAQKGAKNVVVLEQEEAPGLHASGLNAGLAREFEEDAAVAPLAREGVEFIRRPPEGFIDRPLIECNGTLLLYTGDPEKAEIMPASSAYIKAGDAIKMVPPLSSCDFDNAIWTPTDGIVDIHAYLWAFINGAKAKGAKFLMGEKIKAFNVQGSNVVEIETTSGKFECDTIVNATGGWAQAVADMAGAEDLKIRPYRRHLFQTPPMPDVNTKWPFVWHSVHQFYFRPESGGLLLGACDEEEMQPGTPSTDPRITELLAYKLANYCPSLANVSIMRQWCGLRTFAPDKRPVIRWDNKIKNFFWLAGLGGRGMTCAASAGRIAADEIIKR